MEGESEEKERGTEEERKKKLTFEGEGHIRSLLGLPVPTGTSVSAV
jgi:hypothetical protein